MKKGTLIVDLFFGCFGALGIIFAVETIRGCWKPKEGTPTQLFLLRSVQAPSKFLGKDFHITDEKGNDVPDAPGPMYYLIGDKDGKPIFSVEGVPQ